MKPIRVRGNSNALKREYANFANNNIKRCSPNSSIKSSPTHGIPRLLSENGKPDVSGNVITVSSDDDDAVEDNAYGLDYNSNKNVLSMDDYYYDDMDLSYYDDSDNLIDHNDYSEVVAKKRKRNLLLRGSSTDGESKSDNSKNKNERRKRKIAKTENNNDDDKIDEIIRELREVNDANNKTIKKFKNDEKKLFKRSKNINKNKWSSTMDLRNIQRSGLKLVQDKSKITPESVLDESKVAIVSPEDYDDDGIYIGPAKQRSKVVIRQSKLKAGDSNEYLAQLKVKRNIPIRPPSNLRRRRFKRRVIFPPLSYNGKGLEKEFIPYTNNIAYEYYDDPNEICDRLRLLLSSKAAGNSNHDQEINSIIEELRESNIIE